MAHLVSDESVGMFYVLYIQSFRETNGRWYRTFKTSTCLKKVEVQCIRGVIRIMCKGRLRCALCISFLWSLGSLRFLRSALKNLFHSVLPFVIASCIGLSASQSLFTADHSHVALSSVVSSQFNLLTLITFTSLKLNLEIYLSLLHLVSRKDLRCLQKHAHTRTHKQMER